MHSFGNVWKRMFGLMNMNITYYALYLSFFIIFCFLPFFSYMYMYAVQYIIIYTYTFYVLLVGSSYFTYLITLERAHSFLSMTASVSKSKGMQWS